MRERINNRIRKSQARNEETKGEVSVLPRVGQFGGVFSWWPRDPRVDP